jgi:hypothetical protein
VPRQNRVSPFDELIVTSSRGTLMGNRGCLHDPAQRIRRAFVGRRWISCRLEFRGRRRRIMAPGRYTELFFLDEATALAAGHRPCAECQRARYTLFRRHWAAANGRRQPPSADEMDGVLHTERLDARRRKRTYTEMLSRLPGGVMVAEPGGRAHLVQDGRLLRWTPAGYRRAERRGADVRLTVLTPRSIVRAIADGYPVTVHDSATRRHRPPTARRRRRWST